jgi:protein subunit release factor B
MEKEDLERLAAECDEEFFVASGPGGQHRNRTESGVRLTHRPTGFVVTATERRSQAANRTVALERMAEKIAASKRKRTPRVATRPSAGAKRARLEDKRRRSEIKRSRGSLD